MLGFLIVAVVLFNLVAFLIPKKLSRLEIWTTILFASLLEVFVDVCLDLKLNLYGYFNSGFEWASIIPVIGLYPAASTIFLNFFPFKSSRFAQVSYITGVSIFCILFEFASLKFSFFYYHHWRLWYSALCYPILLCVLIWNLAFIRKLNLVSEK